jgi:hypothetical protein
MVVLVPDSERGRRWADRALERIREEAEAVGLSLTTDRTAVLSMAEARPRLVFLGHVIRWRQSRRSRTWCACLGHQPDRITQVLREGWEALRQGRRLRISEAVA